MRSVIRQVNQNNMEALIESIKKDTLHAIKTLDCELQALSNEIIRKEDYIHLCEKKLQKSKAVLENLIDTLQIYKEDIISLEAFVTEVKLIWEH